MAINDYTNFDFNIEQVTKPVDLNIKRQEKVMNSEYFNSSLQSIEKNLDILYEKRAQVIISLLYDWKAPHAYVVPSATPEGF